MDTLNTILAVKDNMCPECLCPLMHDSEQIAHCTNGHQVDLEWIELMRVAMAEKIFYAA